MSVTAQVPMKNTKNVLGTDGEWRFFNGPLLPKPLVCGFSDVTDLDKKIISINMWIYGCLSVIDKPTTSSREFNKIFVNSLTIDYKLTKLRESYIRTMRIPNSSTYIYITVKKNDQRMNDVNFHTKLLKSAE